MVGRTVRTVNIKIHYVFLICFCLGVSPVSSFAAKEIAKKPLTAIVSIPPQKYFVQAIAKDRAKVTVMVPAGYEPEDYSPRPSQLKQLTHAQLYFAIGVPFETTWLKKFQSIAKKLTIIHTEKGIEKMPMQTKHTHAFRRNVKDPHIWLSPTLVRMQAMNILNALIHADPEYADFYRSNYITFALQINALDQTLLNLFGRFDGEGKPIFYIFHPAWGYFARDYGLKQVAIEKGGKSPSIRHLTQITQQAEKQSIKTIFVSPEFSKKSANTVAKAIGGHTVEIDPLAEDWPINLANAADKIYASFREGERFED